jgi:CheY-like chemotaxis protein
MRILVIDDTPTVGSAIKLRLEAGGAEVCYAETAQDGIAALRAEDFDLAMVDIVMPVINGIEAIRLLRQIKPDLPIIAMSGYLDQDNQTSSGGVPHIVPGSVYTLAKPFRPRDLAMAVEACLGTPLPVLPAGAPSPAAGTVTLRR